MEKSFHFILLLTSFVSAESLQCYVCTDCETNYEDKIQTCYDDSIITSTSYEPDLTTTDESVITTTVSPLTTTGDDTDVSIQTSSASYETTTSTTSTLSSDGTTTTTPEAITTPPPETDRTTESENDLTPGNGQNKLPTDPTTESSSSLYTIPVENNNKQQSNKNSEPTTPKETHTSNANSDHEEIIQEPPTMFTSDGKETSTLSDSHTFTTSGIINVQTTPSKDLDTSTITINTEYPVEPIDDSTTLASGDETTTLSDIDDIRVGGKSDSKVNLSQPPNVQMVDENKNYGSRYAFIRTIREVKIDVQRRPHCVVTSYQDQNRTVIVRGCSLVQQDDPMKHCNSLLGDETNINLTRCMVCDQNLCNSATKTMATFMFLILAIIVSF